MADKDGDICRGLGKNILVISTCNSFLLFLVFNNDLLLTLDLRKRYMSREAHLAPFAHSFHFKVHVPLF